MIILDYKDARPMYEQVVDKFQVLIEKEVLKTDEKMPSVRALAIELSINPNTVQKAYAELERRGYIYTVKGKGNFVSYDESMKLQNKKKQENTFAEAAREAMRAGFSREELHAIVDRTEKEGGKHS
ncbi:MAG: GntR family transcriptional regulator [Lachnospiraceae bacterium]|nr:GntR family transcriptional regulator [Lachnospiraceae bacterium]